MRSISEMYSAWLCFGRSAHDRIIKTEYLWTADLLLVARNCCRHSAAGAACMILNDDREWRQACIRICSLPLAQPD